MKAEERQTMNKLWNISSNFPKLHNPELPRNCMIISFWSLCVYWVKFFISPFLSSFAQLGFSTSH